MMARQEAGRRAEMVVGGGGRVRGKNTWTCNLEKWLCISDCTFIPVALLGCRGVTRDGIRMSETRS